MYRYCWLALRSGLFYLGLLLIVVISGFTSCFIWFLPFKNRQKLGTTSNYLILTWLRLACGINVRITGLENLPAGPCVILSNHQSAWESFYIQWLAQPASFVLKRELMWLPFFGWSVAAMRPIAIKRSKPTAAMRQVLKKGQARLKCGLKVVIYPEGTRNPSGELGSFKTGGAALAKLAGVDVVALAHNAGAYWPADSWLKYPGTIEVHIAPPLDSAAYSARELAEKAHSWVSAHLETTGS